jgi:hypothetical protein
LIIDTVSYTVKNAHRTSIAESKRHVKSSGEAAVLV